MQYVVVDNAHASWSERSAVLRNDQPFTGTDLCNTGTQNPLRLRLKYIHRTASSSSLNGNNLHGLNGFSLPKITRLTHTLLIASALNVYGLRRALPQGFAAA
ncbi:hypothetical protein K9931_001305 [Salmonella enterica subsp. enterica serovar Ajiobo]|uniref:hypothetical protein n=1 Tax=Salmonella enterica TaxID=28901 RepID=UPI0019BBF3AA|nr:hypothetical protein [Salmonella enterica subsp. enterica serovar Ajiobo]EIC3756444.1 hypothetical protein [Salmonella enterica subsp. enterica serovar Ajiobo]EII7080736.1 hypothetical protein [Salmonella enterica subsp. enterica serovar Ajiobo]HAK8821149.1 hypothetical protein [Salmonella enterica]